MKNNDIKFREIHCEDEMFLIEILCSTDRIVKFNHPFYIYRRRKNTESHHIKNDLNKFRHRVKNLIKVADVLENILPRIIKRRVGENNNYLMNQIREIHEKTDKLLK